MSGPTATPQSDSNLDVTVTDSEVIAIDINPASFTLTAVNQSLSFTTPNLTISDGNSVDLSTLNPDLSGYALTTYVDSQDGATLSSANTYTDNELLPYALTTALTTGLSNTLSSANTYTDTGDANTLSSANSYTDTAIGNIPADAVTSVNGEVGIVVLATSDLANDSGYLTSTNLSPYALTTALTSGLSNTLSNANYYTDTELLSYATTTALNIGDANTLSSANSYTDTQIAAIPVGGLVDSVNAKTGVVVLTTNDLANNSGFITASTTSTLTNKSGAISQWTNDSGYLTAETDSQTLSFASPNLTISNGNAVDISALTTGFITASSTSTLTNKSGSNSQWTNDAGYITTSSTDTLTNKTLTDPIITNILSDSGFFKFETEYSNPAWSSYNGSFRIQSFADTSNDFLNILQLRTTDNNQFASFVTTDTGGGDDGTHDTSFTLQGDNNTIQSKLSGSSTDAPLEFISSSLKFNDYAFPLYDGTLNQVIVTDGNGQLSFADQGSAVTTSATISAPTQYFSGEATVTNFNDYDSPLFYIRVTDSGGNTAIANRWITIDNLGNISWDWVSLAAGTYTLHVQVQDFNKSAGVETTLSITKANTTFRYWRLKSFTGLTNTTVMVSRLQFFTQVNQGGTIYPANMSNNTTPSPYVASGQGAYGTYDYYKAFNPFQNTFYWNLSSTNQATDYIAIDMGSAINVKSMFITQGQATYGFTGGTIEASLTGAWAGEEVHIVTFTGLEPGNTGKKIN